MKRVVAALLCVAACHETRVYGPEELECTKYAEETDTVAVIISSATDTVAVVEQLQCIELRLKADTTQIWILDPETGEWEKHDG